MQILSERNLLRRKTTFQIFQFEPAIGIRIQSIEFESGTTNSSYIQT